MGIAHEEGGEHMRFRTKKLLALVLALLMLLGLTGVAEDAPLTGNSVVIDDGMIPNVPISNEGISLPGIDLDDNLPNPEPVTTDILIEESEEPNASTEAVEANADPIQLGVNETYKLNTKKLGENLTFKSSKPKIASVSKKGVVKGVKKGTAVITVMSGTKVKAKLAFKVMAAPAKVTLPEKAITIGVKESVNMTPTIPGGSHTTFTWTVKNNAVATVTKAGKITGKNSGTTYITVKTHNGKKASVKVTVKAAPEKVTLNKTKLKLSLFDEVQLKAKLPAGSASNKLIWKSSNESVVSVFENGKLFAEDVGTATITVKTYNGKKATCKVTVVGDELEPEPTVKPTVEPTTTPTVEPTPEPTRKPGITGEISSYFGTDIDSFISILDDELNKEYEWRYSNDYMEVDVNTDTKKIRMISLIGDKSGKYTLFGVHPGTDCEWAKNNISKRFYLYYTSTSSRILQYLYFPNYSSIPGNIWLFEDVDGTVIKIAYGDNSE